MNSEPTAELRISLEDAEGREDYLVGTDVACMGT